MICDQCVDDKNETFFSCKFLTSESAMNGSRHFAFPEAAGTW
ncbi:hypothetical protein OIU78_002518 [Salix suchowensis]|nr:hypothetical protein OIU78_002518 [Salix suchowensis]